MWTVDCGAQGSEWVTEELMGGCPWCDGQPGDPGHPYVDYVDGDESLYEEETGWDDESLEDW